MQNDTTYIYKCLYIYIYVACLPWYTRATWLFLKHRHIWDVHTNGCLRMQCQVKIRCPHFVTTQCDRIKYWDVDPFDRLVHGHHSRQNPWHPIVLISSHGPSEPRRCKSLTVPMPNHRLHPIGWHKWLQPKNVTVEGSYQFGERPSQHNFTKNKLMLKHQPQP